MCFAQNMSWIFWSSPGFWTSSVVLGFCGRDQLWIRPHFWHADTVSLHGTQLISGTRRSWWSPWARAQRQWPRWCTSSAPLPWTIPDFLTWFDASHFGLSGTDRRLQKSFKISKLQSFKVCPNSTPAPCTCCVIYTFGWFITCSIDAP